MNNLTEELAFLRRRYCQLEKKIDKLILLQVNGVDNDLQSILDLVDSDTIQFEDLGEGKITAYALGGGSGGISIDIKDTYSDINLSDINKRFIYVITDEINNSDSSLYIHTGFALMFLLTIPIIP